MDGLEHWDEEWDGPLTEEAARRKLEARGYTVARYVYPPGTVFSDHTHAIDKIDAVLSGRFRMGTPVGDVTLEAGEQVIDATIAVEQPRLWATWDRGAPHCYQLTVRVLDGDRVLDVADELVGFRQVRVTDAGDLSGTQTFVLDASGNPPSISSAPQTPAFVGGYVYPVEVSDPDPDDVFAFELAEFGMGPAHHACGHDTAS